MHWLKYVIDRYSTRNSSIFYIRNGIWNKFWVIRTYQLIESRQNGKEFPNILFVSGWRWQLSTVIAFCSWIQLVDTFHWIQFTSIAFYCSLEFGVGLMLSIFAKCEKQILRNVTYSIFSTGWDGCSKLLCFYWNIK